MSARFSLLVAAALCLGACVKNNPDPKEESAPPKDEAVKPAEETGRAELAGGALKNLLLPPKEAGTVNFRAEGCAAKPNEEPAARKRTL